MDDTPNTADKLAKVYVKIRAERQELAKREQALKEQQETIAKHLLNLCKEQGATTIRTEHGTISRRADTRYWTNDWQSFFNFIRENNALYLLQRRINDTNMEQFLKDNPDTLPPGLNAETSHTVVVTKR